MMYVLVLCVGWLVWSAGVSGDEARTRGPVCVDLDHCVPGQHIKDEFFFTIRDQNKTVQVVIDYSEDQYIEVRCPAGVGLDSSAMPRFQRGSVRNVVLRGCAVPGRGLADTLAALGVTARERLSLADTPHDSRTALGEPQLRGLHHLTRLDIEARHDRHSPAGDQPAPFLLDADALLSFTDLKVLQLNFVKMSTLVFPPSLRSLKLWFIDEKQLNLTGLDHLVSLAVHDKVAVTVNASTARSLETVVLDATRVSFPSSARPASLRHVSLVSWAEADLGEGGCDSVEVLQLRDWDVGEAAPSVSRCSKLRELRVSFTHLKSVSPALVAGLHSLETLVLKYCQIDSLSEGFLKENRALQTLDLSNNNIHTLPSTLFSNLKYLKKLDLSHNKLMSESVAALGALVSLRRLNLSHNPALGDLCTASSGAVLVSGTSPLRGLNALEQLSLANTSVSKVCSDWRTSMKELRTLDLSNTNITSLSYLDLSYDRSRDQKLTVTLHGAPVAELIVDKSNVKSLTADLSTSTLKIILKASLACDCLDYWTAIMFHEISAFQKSMELVCRDQELTLLDALKNNVLECSDPTLFEGESNCTCAYRPDEQLGVVATANCEHGALSEMPALKYSSTPHWRLLLANNHIRTVRAQELPSQLLELDLRNNSVERLGVGAGARLSATLLWLSGNEKLDCTCGGHELLGRAVVQDSAQARCSDGRALNSVPDPGACSSWLGVALAVLGVAAAAVAGAAAYCARPQTRLRVKVLLLRAGWLRRPPESDDGRRYDAFVSYAHEDGAVVEELARRLESELGYRLCLHYRDWGPGEWIHVQIAASVEASRRTLVVVSKHFLRSKWARQEFREAHAAALTDLTPRLLLLFLDPPQDLPLDAELRSYIKKNTYLLWNDSWFWSKLITAMPPPPPKPALSKQEQTV